MKLIKGENNLAAVNPKLAEECNPMKNEELTPNDVTTNSRKNVWWICSGGHEWKAHISDWNDRVGLPTCKYNGIQL